MIKIISTAFILMLAVQSCTLGLGTKTTVKKESNTMPSWVLNPPADTSSTIYGIGSGYSYNDAKEAALKDISSKLIVAISSQTKSEVSQFNSSVARSANQQINTSTLETQLSDYKILQSKQVADELFMQISMSRQGFIKTNSTRLKELDDKIKSTMRSLSRKPKLQQLISVQELEPEIAKARNLVLILQAAGGAQNTDKYLAYYSKVLKKSKDLLYAVRFAVSATSPNMKGFAKHLVALMNNKGLSASVSSHKNANVYIQISGQITSSFMFSQHIAQIKARIKISDKNKRVISVREYQASGSSANNTAAAASASIRVLGQQFKDNGILESLGLIKNNK